jgi:hypothetical protein
MRWTGFILLLAMFGGCTPSGQVKTYPVKGRVMFEGKPMLGGGGISLVPLVDQPGKTAGGTIQPDGTYVLGTYKEADGSMAGEFRVVIFQETVKEGKAAADGSGGAIAGVSTVAAADRIPLIYADGVKSPLTTKIEPKANELDFELKRQ